MLFVLFFLSFILVYVVLMVVDLIIKLWYLFSLKELLRVRFEFFEIGWGYICLEEIVE